MHLPVALAALESPVSKAEDCLVRLLVAHRDWCFLGLVSVETPMFGQQRIG